MPGNDVQCQFTLPHWEYFLAIEDDLIGCSRFVEFSEENYCTYSLEFARIIMVACSEIDTLLKAICKKFNQKFKGRSIGSYYSEVIKKYPNFKKFNVKLPRFKLELKPWEYWCSDSPPCWWSSYNKIKHRRDGNFKKANLITTLFSVTGLFVVLAYYYKESNSGESPALDYRSWPRVISKCHDSDYDVHAICSGFSTPDDPKPDDPKEAKD